MEKRKSVFLGGAILILLLASFLIYSEITAQVEIEIFTQGELVDIMLEVLGLEDQIIPGASYAWKTRQLLSQYAPIDGWGRNNGPNGENAMLTTENMAYIFVQVLGPTDISAGTHVEHFKDLGLMRSHKLPDDEFTLDDVIYFLNRLSLSVENKSIELPSGVSVNPYTTPISPTGP